MTKGLKVMRELSFGKVIEIVKANQQRTRVAYEHFNRLNPTTPLKRGSRKLRDVDEQRVLDRFKLK